jgi:hypothetical protein
VHLLAKKLWNVCLLPVGRHDDVQWWNSMVQLTEFLERSEVHRSLLPLLKLSAMWGFRDAQIFQRSAGNFKFLDARWVTQRTFFLYSGPVNLGITVQNLVSGTTWRPGFLQPCDGYFWTLLPWQIPALKDSHGFRAFDKDFVNKKLLLFCNLVK